MAPTWSPSSTQKQGLSTQQMGTLDLDLFFFLPLYICSPPPPESCQTATVFWPCFFLKFLGNALVISSLTIAVSSHIFVQNLCLWNCLIPGGSEVQVSAWNAGDLGSIPGLGISPGGGHDNPFLQSCLENPQGQKSLAGCSPWGCKELDMTEQLSTY